VARSLKQLIKTIEPLAAWEIVSRFLTEAIEPATAGEQRRTRMMRAGG